MIHLIYFYRIICYLIVLSNLKYSLCNDKYIIVYCFILIINEKYYTFILIKLHFNFVFNFNFENIYNIVLFII